MTKPYPSYLTHEPVEHHLLYCRGCGLPFGKGSMPAVRVSGKGRTAVYAHQQCRDHASTKPVTNSYVVLGKKPKQAKADVPAQQ